MSLQLRLRLLFQNGIVFSGFVPDSKDDGLRLCLADGNHSVSVYLADADEQRHFRTGFELLTERVRARPATKDLVIIDKLQQPTVMLSEVERAPMPQTCYGLTMEIEVMNPNPDVMRALEAGEITEETEQFGEELFGTVVRTYDGLVSYFRNIAKQYWLEPVLVDRVNCHWFLWMCDTEWLDSDGKWRPLRCGPQGQYLGSMTSVAAAVDQSMWAQIALFIEEEGGRASMPDILIANSFQYLSQQDGNMAVVEAVAALESAMKTIVSDVVRGLATEPQHGKQGCATPEDTDIDKLVAKLVDNVVKDAGLAVSARVGLPMIRASAPSIEKDIELTDVQIVTISEAIEERNRLMHGIRRRPVPVKTAQNYLAAIRAGIATLQRWKAHMENEHRLPSAQAV
jgi:hypothetical protein